MLQQRTASVVRETPTYSRAILLQVKALSIPLYRRSTLFPYAGHFLHPIFALFVGDFDLIKPSLLKRSYTCNPPCKTPIVEEEPNIPSRPRTQPITLLRLKYKEHYQFLPSQTNSGAALKISHRLQISSTQFKGRTRHIFFPTSFTHHNSNIRFASVVDSPLDVGECNAYQAVTPGKDEKFFDPGAAVPGLPAIGRPAASKNIIGKLFSRLNFNRLTVSGAAGPPRLFRRDRKSPTNNAKIGCKK